MQMGMIGRGRTGGNTVRRLMRGGHQCVVFDQAANNVSKLASEGAAGTTSLDQFIQQLHPPRAIWLMAPAAVVDATLDQIAPKLQKGDTIIGGGNSYYIEALVKRPGLANCSGRVSDSGQGRWTITAAIEEGAPAPVLSAALFQRFTSRGEADFAGKLLSAMRLEFGGHEEKK